MHGETKAVEDLKLQIYSDDLGNNGELTSCMCVFMVCVRMYACVTTGVRR